MLRSAKVDGNLACCTVNPVLKPFLSPARGGCFFDTKDSGYFDRFYVLGTIDTGGWAFPDFSIPYALSNAAAPRTLQDVQDAEQLAREAAAVCNAEPSAGQVLALGIAGVIATSIIQKNACDNYDRSMGLSH